MFYLTSINIIYLLYSGAHLDIYLFVLLLLLFTVSIRIYAHSFTGRFNLIEIYYMYLLLSSYERYYCRKLREFF